MKPESLTQTFGWRVEYLRDHVNNWTQTELAGRLNKRLGRTTGQGAISQGYISKIEKNQIDPPGKIIAALAREFDVNGEYLLLLSDDLNPQRQEKDTDIFMSEEAGEAAEIIDALTPDRRTEMLQFLLKAAENEKREREKRAVEFNALMSIVEQQLGHEARKKLESSLILSVPVDRPKTSSRSPRAPIRS